MRHAHVDVNAPFEAIAPRTEKNVGAAMGNAKAP